MPVAYVDIPAGVNDGAKKKIFQELYEEIHQAWPIPDTRVLIREWPNEAVSQDGRIENVPMRPICTLAVPPGLEHDAKQRLVLQISNTIGEACGREVEQIRLPSGTKIYNNWVLTLPSSTARQPRPRKGLAKPAKPAPAPGSSACRYQ
jgi:hypothetical protein